MSGVINGSSLYAKLFAEGNRVATQEVMRGTRQVFTRSQIRCPVDLGYLRSTGSMQFRSTPRGPVGKVQYTARYAAAVNDGARPRIIRPRSKSVLKFEVGGRTVYAKQVRWPGFRGRFFLTYAAQEVAAANGWTFRRL